MEMERLEDCATCVYFVPSPDADDVPGLGSCHRHAPVIAPEKPGDTDARWPVVHEWTTGCGDWSVRDIALHADEPPEDDSAE